MEKRYSAAIVFSRRPEDWIDDVLSLSGTIRSLQTIVVNDIDERNLREMAEAVSRMSSKPPEITRHEDIISAYFHHVFLPQHSHDEKWKGFELQTVNLQELPPKTLIYLATCYLQKREEIANRLQQVDGVITVIPQTENETGIIIITHKDLAETLKELNLHFIVILS